MVLHGLFRRNRKDKEDEKNEEDGKRDAESEMETKKDTEEDMLDLDGNTNSSKIEEDEIISKEVNSTKKVEDGIVPADAVVLGVSSSFPTEDSIKKDEPKSKEPKRTKSKNKKKKLKSKKNNDETMQKQSLLKRMFRKNKGSKASSNTQSLSLENATKVEPSDNFPTEKKSKKRGLLPKRWTTYVSIALLFFVAAPVPKRFSSFLEEDPFQGGQKVYSKPRYRTESNKKPDSEIPQEWWKEEKSKLKEEEVPKKEKEVLENPVRVVTPKATSTPPSSSNTIKSSTSFVASAVQQIGPSVVRIDTEIYASASTDPFYGNPFAPSEESDDELVRSGQGSGIIFSHHGLVLTNAHVVEGANRVYVTLTDGRKFVAEVTGADEMVDIAVLKILEHAPWGGHAPWGSANTVPKRDEEPTRKLDFEKSPSSWRGEPLPVANLGDSNNLQVGEFVIAVGNPGGLDNTVTLGIVSSLKRSSEEIGLPSKKVTFIQTDAAVNPGNSGGPLVNEHGEIIGMNTCIRANMEGIAFAIPINKAKEIMFDLAQGKNIQHGYIGVVMMTVTPDFARQNNLDPNSPVGMIPEVHGVMIERVLGNTPAAVDGGLRRLDIVLDIGGITVTNAGEAAKLVDGAKVGEELEITILRAGKEMVTKIKPEDLAEKLRQKKQVQKRQSMQGKGGDGGGGRIYVLPFPTP